MCQSKVNLDAEVRYVCKQQRPILINIISFKDRKYAKSVEMSEIGLPCHAGNTFTHSDSPDRTIAPSHDATALMEEMTRWPETLCYSV